MADNTTINSMSGGDVIATDDVSGVKYQRVKLVDGTADSTTAIAGGANGLKVDLSSTGANTNKILVTPDLPSGAATAAKQLADGHNVAVASIAAGTNLIGKVSIDQVTANANEVVVKSGTVTAVTNITNAVAVTNAGITSIDGKITACNTGAVVLAAGTAAIGKLVANDGVDIGNVDVASIAAGTNVIGKVRLVTATGDEVTEDTGDTVKVSATNLDIRDLTSSSDSIAADITKVAGASVAVDNGTAATSLRVTVASDSTGQIKLAAGTAEIGKLAAGTALIGKVGIDQTTPGTTNGVVEASASAIKTAVEIMDDWDDSDKCKVSDAGGSLTVDGAVTANPTKLPTTDDSEFVNKYYTSAGAVTDGIVWSPAAGKRWYVTDLIINVSAAATVTLEDDKAGGDAAVMKFELAANGGMVCNFKTPLASGEDAADLIVTTTAGNIYITATGYEV